MGKPTREEVASTAWGAGDRLEGLAHAEALAFAIVESWSTTRRRRAPQRPGRQDLWNHVGRPGERRSLDAPGQDSPARGPPKRTSRVYPATKKV